MMSEDVTEKRRLPVISPGTESGTGAWMRIRPYLWILPAVALLGTFNFYPIMFSVALSLFEYNGYGKEIWANFVGLANYVELAGDHYFHKAFYHSLLFVFFGITVQMGIALFLAVFIYMGRFRGASWLRGIIFFPCVLSAIVVSMIWRSMIFIRGGAIHRMTQLFGWADFFPLGSPTWAIYALITVAIWQGVGFNLVIFYAGLQSMSDEVVESAQIDGANFWQLILRIILPLQAHVVLISVILNVIGGIQIFDLAFILIHGMASAVHAADVLAVYMMMNSFNASSVFGGRSALGFASAIAVVMMLMMLSFALIRNRLRRAIDF